MLTELEGFDWQEAFGYAGEPGTCATEYQGALGRPEPCLPDLDISCDPFTREDVEHIVALREGENDGPEWLIYGRLRDGRWFALSAGCDYTGWD